MNDPKLAMVPPADHDPRCPDCGERVDRIEIDPDDSLGTLLPCGHKKDPDEVQTIIQKGMPNKLELLAAAGTALMFVRFANVLKNLLSDPELEYTLYRTRSTDPDAPYATLSISGFAKLSREEYESVKTTLDARDV